MIKIAITPEIPNVNETAYIAAILDAGWDYVHLRHPSLSKLEMKTLLHSIPQRFHDRLKLHSHFDLTKEFYLGGLHLNSRSSSAPISYAGKISRSCHTIEELADSQRYEYVMLSPIYNSLSKKGYNAAFTDAELRSISAKNVIALGGVTANCLKHLQQYNFAGFAMLGYLFQSANNNELISRLNLIETNL